MPYVGPQIILIRVNCRLKNLIQVFISFKGTNLLQSAGENVVALQGLLQTQREK